MAEFTDFWAIAKPWRRPYGNPRKGRGGAESAWEKCIKEGADSDEMVLGAEGYDGIIEQEHIEPKMVCMAVTFLNQWRFEQYADMAREAAAAKAEAFIERRRTYYRFGCRDTRTGEGRDLTDLPAEVREAYEMGVRDTEAAPKLELVK